ncbi:hypothetical protein CHARACLAT_017835 [Characodon lateralis]|uniref:Cerebellar degeneration-related protein 2 n=1 Tax=Characodon lateralis TaxID=208331 RepID=A0ABU7DBF4_9TELE|nr:hypothetical protein [Characodon lateralis]
MLADMIAEEEFEIKEEEPWYDKQDLEHDLQLAAELGKSLLERNRDLEQGLQQMYTTNQEQLQEIEYLTKQVDVLRQVNDQHAKVYEQLDVSARELEQSNQKLVLDNRAAQLKIHRLMETVDELQHHVEELKLASCQSQRSPCGEKWPPRGTRSVSCLQELQNTHRYDLDLDQRSDGFEGSAASWHEEEHASLQQSLRALQTQFAAERARREEAETEGELLARENAALEQQLGRMEGCQARISELEKEAEELRQLWKLQSSSRPARSYVIHGMEEEIEGVSAAVKSPALLKRWASERLMKATQAPDSPNRIYDHECSCVRRPEVVKYRGISLLNEVDAQYSALQVKYDELLRRCGHQEELQELLPGESSAAVDSEDSEDDFHQPEYKELFKEIFSRIQKTKELIENRRGDPVAEVPPSLD